jgi:hypothetical protein
VNVISLVLLLALTFGSFLLIGGVLGLVFVQTGIPTDQEICNDGIDNDSDRVIDEVECIQSGQSSPAAPLDPFLRPP